MTQNWYVAGTDDGKGILTFTTLSDLQAAFPDGIDKPVWITADNSWYYWTGSLSPILLSDNFDRPDSTNRLAGDGYTLFADSAPADWGIISGKAYAPTQPVGAITGIVKDAGEYNVSVKADLTMGGSGTDFPGIVLNYTDLSNFILVRGDSGTGFAMKIKDAGTYKTPIANSAFAFTQGQVISVEFKRKNSLIEILANGTLIGSYTMTAAEETKFRGKKHGVGAKSPNDRIDNLVITRI